MNKKLEIGIWLLLSIIIGFVFLFIYGIVRLFPDPIVLTDKEVATIINKTAVTFQKETFQKEPFAKAKELENLAHFLVQNADTIFRYHPDDTYLSDHCFHLSQKTDAFINTHIPPHLQEALKNHLKKLDSLVVSFELCNKKYNHPNKTPMPSLQIFLKDKTFSNEPYIVSRHSICLNKSYVNNKVPPKDFYGEDMRKDTLLTGNLRYLIEVFPITPGK